LLISKTEEDGSEEYRIVNELIVSNVLRKRETTPYMGEICNLKLNGVSLGDTASTLLERIHGLTRSRKMVKFFGKVVEEFYVNPDSEDSNLYYRYYVRNGVVIAFSIGVTE